MINAFLKIYLVTFSRLNDIISKKTGIYVIVAQQQIVSTKMQAYCGRNFLFFLLPIILISENSVKTKYVLIER